MNKTEIKKIFNQFYTLDKKVYQGGKATITIGGKQLNYRIWAFCLNHDTSEGFYIFDDDFSYSPICEFSQWVEKYAGFDPYEYLNAKKIVNSFSEDLRSLKKTFQALSKEEKEAFCIAYHNSSADAAATKNTSNNTIFKIFWLRYEEAKRKVEEKKAKKNDPHLGQYIEVKLNGKTYKAEVKTAL